MGYPIIFILIAIFCFLVFAVLNFIYHFIRACALMLWDLDRAYENEVLKKTKEYKDFEDELGRLL